MLNPLEAVDSQPEVRYTNAAGLGAVHLAVKRDRLDILKILLEADKTLLCMPTEDEHLSYIIHLAVQENNQTIIRYLLGDPAFFRLLSDKSEYSYGLIVNNQNQVDPYARPEDDLPVDVTEETGLKTGGRPRSAGLREETPEETLLTLKDGKGNSPIHLMFK